MHIAFGLFALATIATLSGLAFIAGEVDSFSEWAFAAKEMLFGTQMLSFPWAGSTIIWLMVRKYYRLLPEDRYGV